MNIPRKLKTAMLAIAISATISPVVMAQSDFNTRDASQSSKKHAKDTSVQLFPKATRTDPGGVVSESLGKPINDLLALVNQRGHEDEVIATGTKLSGSKDAKKFDLAIIYQAMAYAYLNKGDNANGIQYLQKSIGEDMLSNNDQYQLMLMLARAQINADQPDAGIATLARVVAETKEDKPEYDGIRGQLLYAKKDYAAAAEALQKAVEGSTQPDSNVQQPLMASYFELKQPERAEKIGEDILRTKPNDKAAIMNLATAYQEGGQSEKAATTLEDARKRGLFTSADDYRSLYALYSNIKGHENDSAAVINEGFQKGILQPNEEVYMILAQDYYFTNQTPQAIEAYKKADALPTADGEPALYLAKIYNNQHQLTEAKAAAQRALQKGVKQPEDARAIIQSTGAQQKSSKKN
jgi:Flp pilus assembly protein TadD